MKTHRLDLGMLLPDLPEGPDPRVATLVGVVRQASGVEACSVRDQGAGPLLTVRYDAGVLSEEGVEEIVRDAARALERAPSRVLFSFETPLDGDRARGIEAWIERLPGVIAAAVDREAGWVRVEYRRAIAPVGRIVRYLREAGVVAGSEVADSGGRDERSEVPFRAAPTEDERP